MRTILLTGATGQLGCELLPLLSQSHLVRTLTRKDVDLTDTEKLQLFLDKLEPVDLIINAAAYTNVEEAENQLFLAHSLNITVPQTLAQSAQKRKIPIVHFSTDYVFDGTLPLSQKYTENDTTTPLSVYGKTKREGEIAVSNTCEKHLIFRLCWMYGHQSRNFLQTMVQLYDKEITPHVVNDQFSSPTWSKTIAQAVTQIVSRIDDQGKQFWGTYHLSSETTCSWYDFSVRIFEKLNRRNHKQLALPKAIASPDYPTKATRPKNSQLNPQLVARTFGITLPNWKTQLEHFFLTWNFCR